ncbi:MAG: SGNH/GDSL hydrolase family protein [Kiritimatiellaeota bacterium]|nr:SGNH/GDSL hydrolase family protein [Kiritimatiellota bacterium]
MESFQGLEKYDKSFEYETARDIYWLPVRRGGAGIMSGEKAAFLGDSITAQGWTSAHGYVRLVVVGLEANGVKLVPVPAGVGGHTSKDMLARLKRDVLDKKPDWVTISCGMNDVLPGRGVPLAQFKSNLTDMVAQCQAAGIKVVLLTTTTGRQHLEEYSAASRALAQEKKCLLVDLFPLFVEAGRTATPLRSLTYDGVHMNPEGNLLLARTILKTFGCTEAQIAKAGETWLDLPNAGDLAARVDVELNKKYFRVTCALTLREREKLLGVAAASKKPTLMHWSKDFLNALMKKKVKPAGTFADLDALFAPGVRQQVQDELQHEFEQELRKLVAEK